MAGNSGRCRVADCWLIPRSLMRLPIRRFFSWKSGGIRRNGERGRKAIEEKYNCNLPPK